MKRFARLAAVFCLAVALWSPPALAGEDIKGTITATVTKNNNDTAVPFSLSGVNMIVVQCDTAAYVRQGVSATLTASTTTGRLLEAGKERYYNLQTGGRTIAIVAVAGTSVCTVSAVY